MVFEMSDAPVGKKMGLTMTRRYKGFSFSFCFFPFCFVFGGGERVIEKAS